MSASLPAPRHRRVLVAVGAVAAPILLDAGNLIAPYSDGSAAQQLAVIHSHETAYWVGQTMAAAGFGLLGAVGVAVAMLVPRRGAVLATIGAFVTLVGGFVAGGTVLVVAVVDAAIPASRADVLTLLQGSPVIGALFQASAVAGIGGLLGAIALLIARTAGVLAPIVLLVGLLLSAVQVGPATAVLSLPLIAAAVLIARALLRTRPLEAAVPAREVVTA